MPSAAWHTKSSLIEFFAQFVLGDENDPDWSEEMAQKILSFHGDGVGIIQKVFGTGPYALRQDNCGEAFCRATNNNTPGLPKVEGLLSDNGDYGNHEESALEYRLP